MIELNEIQIEKIREHTLNCYPHESCGLILKDDFIPCENISPNPMRAFEIDKDIFNKYSNEVIGIYHNHVRVPGNDADAVKSYDARTPSPMDVMSCKALGIPFIISATDGENVMPFIQYPQDPNTYLYSREFIFYINDCFTLVRDYLFQNYNILLPEHHETFDWYNDGKGIIVPYYDKYYKDWGFYEITEEESEVGDVVIMSISGTANHLGVIVEDNKIFHHATNQCPSMLSKSRLKSYIHRYLRHKDKK